MGILSLSLDAVPLVLLEQITSRFLTGALRAVWGKGTKTPVSHGLSLKIKCLDRLNTMYWTQHDYFLSHSFVQGRGKGEN